MRKVISKSVFGGLAFFVIVLNSIVSTAEVKVLPPPLTEALEIVDTLHGVPVPDPYRWLEDRESPETQAWIDIQNEYSNSIIEAVPYREKLKNRFAELLRVDRISMPTQRGNRFFLYRKAADEEQYSIYMREGLYGEDVLLIDPARLSADLTRTVGIMDVSPDGRVLAFSIRDGGEDEVVVRLMDVGDRKILTDVLPRAVYFGFRFKKDMSGFYYSRRDEEGSRIYYHKMGFDLSDDRQIFGEGYGPEHIVYFKTPPDRRFMLIYVSHGSSGERIEIYYKDIIEDGEIRTLVNDIDAVFDVHMGGDRVFMQTNWEAPNWKVLTFDINNPSRENWREFIPESDAILQSISTVGGRVFARYLENVSSHMKIYDTVGNYIEDISFPTLGTVSSMKGRWDSDVAFYSFHSFYYPETMFHYSVSSGEQKIWDRPDIPVNMEDFKVEQVWYKSKDGTSIPMFLVHGNDLKLDGENPTMIVGYGGFRSSYTPRFKAQAVSLVENGGIYAVANIRGGGEFGENWHRAGMLENKQNCFDDFIAAAEWLIEKGYTNPSKLAIRGGSNGGLLVAAAMNQRPVLFKAVICTYPLLDMIRYHKFMMGPYWITEYGSADDPEQFRYIMDYSPYHNVKPGTEYPAVLFITGNCLCTPEK
jgi:prolyl oligopeptidase